MRIDHLYVRNFKGFVERDFYFRRSVDTGPGNGSFHILIGENGRGKTTTLDALAVAAGSWLLGVPRAESRHIKEADIRIEVNPHGDTQRIEKQLPVVVR